MSFYEPGEYEKSVAKELSLIQGALETRKKLKAYVDDEIDEKTLQEEMINRQSKPVVDSINQLGEKFDTLRPDQTTDKFISSIFGAISVIDDQLEQSSNPNHLVDEHGMLYAFGLIKDNLKKLSKYITRSNDVQLGEVDESIGNIEGRLEIIRQINNDKFPFVSQGVESVNADITELQRNIAKYRLPRDKRRNQQQYDDELVDEIDDNEDILELRRLGLNIPDNVPLIETAPVVLKEKTALLAEIRKEIKQEKLKQVDDDEPNAKIDALEVKEAEVEEQVSAVKIVLSKAKKEALERIKRNKKEQEQLAEARIKKQSGKKGKSQSSNSDATDAPIESSNAPPPPSINKPRKSQRIEQAKVKTEAEQLKEEEAQEKGNFLKELTKKSKSKSKTKDEPEETPEEEQARIAKAEAIKQEKADKETKAREKTIANATKKHDALVAERDELKAIQNPTIKQTLRLQQLPVLIREQKLKMTGKGVPSKTTRLTKTPGAVSPKQFLELQKTGIDQSKLQLGKGSSTPPPRNNNTKRPYVITGEWFGNLKIDKTALNQNMRVIAHDGAKKVMDRAIDLSTFDLLTKNWNSKKEYSKGAWQTFTDLLALSDLSVAGKQGGTKVDKVREAVAKIREKKRTGNGIKGCGIKLYKSSAELENRKKLIDGVIRTGNNNPELVEEKSEIDEVLNKARAKK